MSITFQVIDLSCQQTDASFFVPQVNLTAVSTTKYATLYGWSELGSHPSTPPKKYKKVTVSGTSERIAYTAEPTPRQCAGAKYVWSGVGEISATNHLISTYNRKFYGQCSKQYWPVEPIQLNSISTPTSLFPAFFVGYCWPADANSCPVCDPVEANWPLLSTRTPTDTNSLIVDLGAFLHSLPVETTTSTTVNSVIQNILSFTDPGTFTPTGITYNVTVGANTYSAQEAIPASPTPLPHQVINGLEGAYVVYTDTSNFSAVLSDEYTDAEALLNAKTVTGTGSTASTLPRTTGFTSIYASVTFKLHFSNLIAGTDYTATVDLWERSAEVNPETGEPAVSTHTTRTYGFTASATTHDINDTVPTPVAGNTITVRQPTVSVTI